MSEFPRKHRFVQCLCVCWQTLESLEEHMWALFHVLSELNQSKEDGDNQSWTSSPEGDGTKIWPSGDAGSYLSHKIL